jgi:hypothetical protein
VRRFARSGRLGALKPISVAVMAKSAAPISTATPIAWP